MKKLIFIIPYFGEFNNYFQLFLNSCEKNPEINWLIFTDDKKKYNYPPNIKVEYTTFKLIKENIQKKFDFKIKLERPYKLCDYRPAYGYIFEEYLNEYEYWGYCDTDILFGNIKIQLFPLLEKKYDKLFFLGHCSIYKNNFDNNRFFQSQINNKERYKEVYQNNENNSFDEEFKNSINNIFINRNKNILLKGLEANLYMKSSKLKLIKYNFKNKKYEVDKIKKRIFIYDNGNIVEYYKENNKIQTKNYLYIHFQSRKMEVKVDKFNNKFKILSNSFENMEFEKITLENFDKIKKGRINLHYFKLCIKNLKIKIKKRIERYKNGN